MSLSRSTEKYNRPQRHRPAAERITATSGRIGPLNARPPHLLTLQPPPKTAPSPLHLSTELHEQLHLLGLLLLATTSFLHLLSQSRFLLNKRRTNTNRSDIYDLSASVASQTASKPFRCLQCLLALLALAPVQWSSSSLADERAPSFFLLVARGTMRTSSLS